MQAARQFWQQFSTIPTTDPEDARRRRLLNILLAGMYVVVILVPLAVLITSANLESWEQAWLIAGSAVMFVGTTMIWLINRYGAGWLASALFILMIVFIFAFGDAPEEVLNGRSLFFLTIPILMASVLLRPYTSFVVAVFVQLLLGAIAFASGLPINLIAMLGFFMIALVSWLSARSLEKALRDLRQINQELDQRVAERTRDLNEALKREQNESSKNQAILTSIADGVVFFDEGGRVLLANDALTVLLDRPQADLTWLTLADLMRDAVPESDQQALLAYRDQPHSDQSKLQVHWGQRVLSVSFAPVRTTDEQILGSVMVCRDFTAETELNKLKDRFLSMTSHELRTPLNAILGYTDMLQAAVYGPLADKQGEMIVRVNANAKRMLGLVNNILDQAQLEAGTFHVQRTKFAVESLLEEVEHMTSVLASHQGLSLTFAVDDAVPDFIESDVRRLSQVLLNLVGNAIKFTRQGGVQVRAYCPDAAHWAIEVTDSGVGIPPDAQSVIFEPFRQANNPLTRDTTGSGLGLSIVKQIVTLLGGQIMLRSSVGVGSTFTVTLPLQPEAAPVALETITAAHPQPERI